MIIETREFEPRIVIGTISVLAGSFLMIVNLVFYKQVRRFYDWQMRRLLPGMWTGKMTRGARLFDQWAPALFGLCALVYGILVLCGWINNMPSRFTGPLDH